MVFAKPCSKRSCSRYQRRNRSKPSSNSSRSHNCYGSSKMSITRRSSPRGGGRGRQQSRYNSTDSLYSRDSSYGRLTRPSKHSKMSGHQRRPPHFDRMVCDAIARIKSRKGSSIKDIVKTLENKYSNNLKGKGTAEKVVARARKLVKEGKLVKDGGHYRLSKTSSRSSKDSDDYYYNDDSSRRSHSGGKHSSYSGRSSKRGRPRKRSRSQSSDSRSRSQSSPPRRKRQLTTTHRKQRKVSRIYKTSKRGRGTRRRGAKRKKGPRKGQTRLAVGRRGPRRKVRRARRRVKHSTHTKRPKSDKLPEGDGSQNKGWFGGWFGARGGGDTTAAQQKSDKSSNSKSETKKSRSSSERSSSEET